MCISKSCDSPIMTTLWISNRFEVNTLANSVLSLDEIVWYYHSESFGKKLLTVQIESEYHRLFSMLLCFYHISTWLYLARSLISFWADKPGWYWFVVRGKHCIMTDKPWLKPTSEQADYLLGYFFIWWKNQIKWSAEAFISSCGLIWRGSYMDVRVCTQI